ncbi:MAG: AI-2E family transporter [Acidobacteria bacterium]|nr:MAG: AI-2E family transporter [Acidobacteriota bacterium]REJ99555.1 MAG: AI-2E family transporter [Acidobacteriota bacterium]
MNESRRMSRRVTREAEGGTPRGARNLLAAASVVVLVAGLKAASSIIVPLLIALFISALSLPLVGLLRQRGLSPGLAVFATMAVDIACLFALVLVVSNSFNELVRERAKYEARIREFRAGVERQVSHTRAWLEDHGIATEDWFGDRFGDPEDVEPSLSPADAPRQRAAALPASPRRRGTATAEQGGEAVAASDAPWLTLFDIGALVDAANRTLRGVANLLTNALLVLLITTFVLLEATTFPKKLRRAFGNSLAEERFGRIMFDLRRYLSVKTAISMATGMILGIWVAILGLDFAPLWGLLAFALNYIPNLGSIIAAIPPVLLALVQQGFGLALLVAAGYLVVNVVIGNFIEPHVMGRRLGLSTLVVFLSLVFWGWVWGPVGMLLSVPLTMVVKILLENSRDFRWIAVMMDGHERRQPSPPRGESRAEA